MLDVLFMVFDMVLLLYELLPTLFIECCTSRGCRLTVFLMREFAELKVKQIRTQLPPSRFRECIFLLYRQPSTLVDIFFKLADIHLHLSISDVQIVVRAGRHFAAIYLWPPSFLRLQNLTNLTRICLSFHCTHMDYVLKPDTRIVASTMYTAVQW